jgi:hypothetical protein
MLQNGSIERILLHHGLSNSGSSKRKPTGEILSPALRASPPFEESFNYCSILGKILYVLSNTRCEIALANHQCAKFSNDPRSHMVSL